MGGPVDRPRAPLSRSLGRGAALAIPVLFLAVFFVLPVTQIVGRGVWDDGRPDLGPVVRVVTDPALRRVAWFTVWQATLSTALTLAFGLPAAYVLSRFSFPGRRPLRALVLVPFVLPTVVVGAAFIGLLGPGGPVVAVLRWVGLEAPDGLHRTLGVLLAAHVFFNLAVVVRVVGSFWDHVDPAVEESAEALGAGRIQTFRRVLLPLARPAVGGAAALVFLFTFTSFGVVLLLGGAGRSTLEVEIYRQTAQLLDLRTAAALAIVQIVFVSAFLWIEAVLGSRAAVRQPLTRPVDAARSPTTRAERAGVALVAGSLAAFLLVPPLALLWRALGGPSGPSLRPFLGLGEARAGSVLPVAPLEAIGTSLLMAGAAAVVALAIGIPTAFAVARLRRSAWLIALVALPLGVSAVTIGFGYVVAFDEAPLDLRGTWWIVPLAQAVVAIPFVVRIVAPVVASIETGLADAGADLGAAPREVLRRVTVPLARGAFLAAGAFAFVVSLGEFGAAAFLAAADRPTMPVAIARLLSQPGSASLARAAAMSVILMVVTAVAVLSIDRGGGGAR